MGKNSLVQLSRIITDDVTKNDLKEIESALKDINEILSIQKVTKEHILKELTIKKTDKLCEYLDQTEKNILTLNTYVEELNTKKRLLEYETKRAINAKSFINL